MLLLLWELYLGLQNRVVVSFYKNQAARINAINKKVYPFLLPTIKGVWSHLVVKISFKEHPNNATPVEYVHVVQ